MSWDHLIRERHRWHRYAKSFLVVALEVPPASFPSAPLAWELAKALVAQERRERLEGGVLLAELDFWAPALASTAGLEAPPKDLLDLFQALAEDTRMHGSLRFTEGVPSSLKDLQTWKQRLASEWPPGEPLVGGIHLLPARTGKEAAMRCFGTSPSQLVSVKAKPAPLPGAFVLRALLASAVERYRPGILLLTLPTGWNGLSAMVSSSIADVMTLVSRGEERELDHWEPVLTYLQTRRRASVSRPESEEEVHLFFGEYGSQPLQELVEFRQPVRIGSEDGGPVTAAVLAPVARELDLLAAIKGTGVGPRVVEASSADRELLDEISAWPEAEVALRIVVEEGAYGEYPLRQLSERSFEALRKLSPTADLKGFRLEPIPITHAELLGKIQEKEQGPEDFKSWLEEERVDLLTFPHYMLGALAEQDVLLPWHVLEDAVGQEDGPPILSAEEVVAAFHRVDEMCRYNGVLFAVPYSLLQKLLLVKKCAPWNEEPTSWGEVEARLQRQLSEGQKGAGSWPLLLETELNHVGIWYDWLEFVNAYGGADFRPSAAGTPRGSDYSGAEFRPSTAGTFRGSDYGECWINHPRTVEGTAAYLRLLRRTLERFPEPVDWDRLLGHFLGKEDVWATTAWSDIVSYHWNLLGPGQAGEDAAPIGLREKVHAYPFPLGSAGVGRTSVEGWVLAVPRTIEGHRRRLAGRTVSWFLGAEVQRRYAEVGGNTARRNLGHVLGEIPRTVHRSLFFPLVEPALKMTFREAPEVIAAIGQQLRGWLRSLRDEGQEPRKETLEEGLDSLARTLCSEVLRDKARYRSPEWWQRLQENGTAEMDR